MLQNKIPAIKEHPAPSKFRYVTFLCSVHHFCSPGPESGSHLIRTTIQNSRLLSFSLLFQVAAVIVTILTSPAGVQEL
jgi:hypothetical protein